MKPVAAAIGGPSENRLRPRGKAIPAARSKPVAARSTATGCRGSRAGSRVFCVAVSFLKFLNFCLYRNRKPKNFCRAAVCRNNGYGSFIQLLFNAVSVFILQHFLFKPFSDGLDVWNSCIVFLVYNFCQYRNSNKFETGGNEINIAVC